ncbi:MAG: methionyl-tRNA formyltransferase, partial [Proteobacteria bacterium]
LALAHGLRVFTPETVNKQEFRDEIAALRAQSAAVVAFGQILGQKFLDLFPQGCVNVHGSILPRWRGAAPIQRALMAGDKESGVALQIVVRALDAGPVLGIRKLDLPEDMDAMVLHDTLKDLGADLLHVEYMDYLRGNLTPTPQDESLVTIAPKIDKSEARLDWKQEARSLHDLIRGLQMGPFAFTTRHGAGGRASVKIHKTRIVDETTVGSSGRLAFKDGRLVVSCGKGLLEILEIQPESRSRMSATDYLRGHPLQENESFE